MTEALISALARIRALKVISRTSVMRYKHTNTRLPQIARELGVDAVVEGAVTLTGGRVRVTEDVGVVGPVALPTLPGSGAARWHPMSGEVRRQLCVARGSFLQRIGARRSSGLANPTADCVLRHISIISGSVEYPQIAMTRPYPWRGRWRIMPRRHVFLLLLLTAAVSAQFSPASENVPPQNEQQLLRLVPDPLPAGLAAQGTPAFFKPETLYQYMDGGADAFLSYDFQTLLHQEFRAGEVELTVDVFDMGTPENAFGIYAAERAPWYNFIPIGTEAYKNEGILNSLQGRYYVKLAAFGGGSDSVLEQFARVLSSRIGDRGSFPALLQQLPQAHLKQRSEQYLLKDPLGHPFLRPAYLATYSLDNQESTLLVSVAGDETEARQRLKLLDQHFRETGKSESAPDLGSGAIRASNSFEGRLIAQVKGRYLIALFNPVAGAPDILKEAVDRLK